MVVGLGDILSWGYFRRFLEFLYQFSSGGVPVKIPDLHGSVENTA